MKKYFLLFSILISINSLIAQDTIYKRSGETIVAKISELTPTEIKYKRFDFQDGPTYTVLKSTVESIKYSNGLKESFKKEEIAPTGVTTEKPDYYVAGTQNNKISIRGRQFFYKNQYHSEKEIQNFLLETRNKEIVGYVTKSRQAKKMQYIGFAAIPLGLIGLVALASSTTTNYNGTTSTNGGVAALGGYVL